MFQHSLPWPPKPRMGDPSAPGALRVAFMRAMVFFMRSRFGGGTCMPGVGRMNFAAYCRAALGAMASLVKTRGLVAGERLVLLSWAEVHGAFSACTSWREPLPKWCP